MTPQQQFTRKVRQLIAESRQLSPRAMRQILELLDEARKRVAGQIAILDPASFQAAQLQSIRTSIDVAFDTFRAEATVTLNGAQAEAARLGAATIDEPLAAIGLDAAALGQVSTDTLRIAQSYTADLLTGLSELGKAQVNSAIQRAFLGGQSTDEILQQIGRGLSPGGKLTGRVDLFSKFGMRVQRVAVTEILRVHSISAQARLTDLAGRHPALKKIWKWVPASLAPRHTHQDISGQVRKVKEAFDVPIPRLGRIEKLMFPRDPAGSAENTINCHCVLTPHFDKNVLRPTGKQKGLLKDLGITIVAA